MLRGPREGSKRAPGNCIQHTQIYTKHLYPQDKVTVLEDTAQGWDPVEWTRSQGPRTGKNGKG